MPTFKANYAEYDPKLSAEQNMGGLIDNYNDLVSRLLYTVNNLDDENISSSLLQSNTTSATTDNTTQEE